MLADLKGQASVVSGRTKLTKLLNDMQSKLKKVTFGPQRYSECFVPIARLVFPIMLHKGGPHYDASILCVITKRQRKPRTSLHIQSGAKKSDQVLQKTVER